MLDSWWSAKQTDGVFGCGPIGTALPEGSPGSTSGYVVAVQALYMIECVKRGIPLPPRVPPGQFPPVAGTVNISSLIVSALA